MHMHPHRGHAAHQSDHPVAGQQQRNNGTPDPDEKAAEQLAPERQALRRFQYFGRHRTQALVGKKHAPHPDNGSKQVQTNGQRHG
jgi:hypothetical protein